MVTPARFERATFPLAGVFRRPINQRPTKCTGPVWVHSRLNTPPHLLQPCPLSGLADILWARLRLCQRLTRLERSLDPCRGGNRRHGQAPGLLLLLTSGRQAGQRFKRFAWDGIQQPGHSRAQAHLQVQPGTSSVCHIFRASRRTHTAPPSPHLTLAICRTLHHSTLPSPIWTQPEGAVVSESTASCDLSVGCSSGASLENGGYHTCPVPKEPG